MPPLKRPMGRLQRVPMAGNVYPGPPKQPYNKNQKTAQKNESLKETLKRLRINNDY